MHGRLRSKEYVRLTKPSLNRFNQNLRDSTFSEDQCHCPVWRFPDGFLQTFRFLPIMDLFRLRQVCSTFKDEVGLQVKLGIFDPTKDPVQLSLCDDPRYYVPNPSWIRLKNLKEHLPTLKSVFPSVKVLVINSSYRLYIEDILDSFVHLESLAIDDEIECYDTNRSYSQLKHCF